MSVSASARPIRTTELPAATTRGKDPPIAFAFALLSAVLALLTMRLLGTPILDAGAYRIAIGIAAGTGLATGLAVRLLRSSPRLRKLSWALVPIAGAMVGMSVQWVLLSRAPAERTYVLASGLTTGEPVAWVLAGAPFGALPALVVAFVLALAVRVVSTTAALDSRERMMLPFAAACALLGAATLGSVDVTEIPVVAGIVLLAMGALVEILFRDRARNAWLERVYAGDDATHVVIPLEEMTSGADLPLAVGAVRPEAVIVRIDLEPGYRGTARVPIATTALFAHLAAQPLLARRRALLASLAGTMIVALGALATRLS